MGLTGRVASAAAPSVASAPPGPVSATPALARPAGYVRSAPGAPDMGGPDDLFRVRKEGCDMLPGLRRAALSQVRDVRRVRMRLGLPQMCRALRRRGGLMAGGRWKKAGEWIRWRRRFAWTPKTCVMCGATVWLRMFSERSSVIGKYRGAGRSTMRWLYTTRWTSYCQTCRRSL